MKVVPVEGDPAPSPPLDNVDCVDTVIRSLRQEPATPKYNDVFFTVLFVGQLLAVSVIAFWKGLPAVIKGAHDYQVKSNNNGNVGAAVGMILLLVFVAGTLTFVWLRVLIAHAESMIHIAIWMNASFMLVIALGMIPVHFTAVIFFLILAALSLCYLHRMRNRIMFASANLKAACKAVQEYPALFSVATVLLVFQLVGMLLWTLSVVGVIQLFMSASESNASEGKKYGDRAYLVIFFMLIGAYWGQQVLQNVMRCTTAGVVATWWYQPEIKNATSAAAYRSITTSFGSICFGSLIVAVFEALKTMSSLKGGKKGKDGGFALIACIAQCILKTLAKFIDYVNQWAFVYVGIYGNGFYTSGKAVISLFKNRGWTAIINDDLVKGALRIGAFGVGITTCFIGILLGYLSPASWFEPLGSRFAILSLAGLFAGTGITVIFSQVVVAALHTIFVCFAEDPLPLGRNHPAENAALVEAWRTFYFGPLTMAYGSAV